MTEEIFRTTADEDEILVGVTASICFAIKVPVLIFVPCGRLVPGGPGYGMHIAARWTFNLGRIGISEAVPAMLGRRLEPFFCFGTGVIFERAIVNARVDYCPWEPCPPRIHLAQEYTIFQEISRIELICMPDHDDVCIDNQSRECRNRFQVMCLPSGGRLLRSNFNVLPVHGLLVTVMTAD